jgi:hypothetical protein
MMDIADDFKLLSFESGDTLFGNDTEFTFEGVSLPSRTDIVAGGSNATGGSDDSDERVTIERFFEVCFDTDMQVLGEDEFDKGRFLGAGAAMTVFQGHWRKPSRAVAMKSASFLVIVFVLALTSFVDTSMQALVDVSSHPQLEEQITRRSWARVCLNYKFFHITSFDFMKTLRIS